jgi:hypothetical protein
VNKVRVALLVMLIAAPLMFAQPTAAGETWDSTAKLKLTGHLTAKVTVVATSESIEDGPPNSACEAYRPVVIQRKKAGKWTKVKAGSTGPWQTPEGESQPWGIYKTPIPDKGGQYRAVAKKMELDGGVCVKAISKVAKHEH